LPHGYCHPPRINSVNPLFLQLAQKEEDLKFLLSLKAWKDKEKKADFVVGYIRNLASHADDFCRALTIILKGSPSS
jgi:hypothetical protein